MRRVKYAGKRRKERGNARVRCRLLDDRYCRTCLPFISRYLSPVVSRRLLIRLQSWRILFCMRKIKNPANQVVAREFSAIKRHLFVKLRVLNANILKKHPVGEGLLLRFQSELKCVKGLKKLSSSFLPTVARKKKWWCEYF